MLKSLFDTVMEHRAERLITLLGDWLPPRGPVLDLGSGTGHLAGRLERERGLEVVTADVSDMHVRGRPPILIGDGALPFATDTYSAALLIFMLAYPKDPPSLLREVARVTRGPIILCQTLHAHRLAYAWFRAREFAWTIMAFHVAKIVGYVPPHAQFTMSTRRFYTDATLRRDIAAAGLRIDARRTRAVLPGGSLEVASLRLGRDG